MLITYKFTFSNDKNYSWNSKDYLSYLQVEKVGLSEGSCDERLASGKKVTSPRVQASIPLKSIPLAFT